MSTAWVTLATTDGYAIGALVLAQSLRNVNTLHKLHVLYTTGVSPQLIQQLISSFNDATEVNLLDSGDHENLALINRPDLGVTFTKLHCWRLTQYSKCVFLDADTFVVKNADELFEHPEFSAAPDIGWPDYFNTGVFVFVPSIQTYQNLLQFALSHGSFDGGDQGLLNKYFHNWREQDVSHRLSFLYNVTSNAIYSYAAAIKRHISDIKIVHFLGKLKPWHMSSAHKGNDGVSSAVVSEQLKSWQKVYTEVVQHNLPASLVRHSRRRVLELTAATTILNNGGGSDKSIVSASLTENMDKNAVIGSQLKLMGFTMSTNPLKEQNPPQYHQQSESEKRYEAWEYGQPDYAGNDAFDNIQKVIDKSLEN